MHARHDSCSKVSVYQVRAIHARLPSPRAIVYIITMRILSNIT